MACRLKALVLAAPLAAIALLASGCAASSAAPAASRAISQLRAEYPLYSGQGPGDSGIVPFEKRIALADTLAFATVTDDPSVVEIPSGPPVDDPAFAGKHPGSDAPAKLYVYPVRIDEVVAGAGFDTKFYAYSPDSVVKEGGFLPKKGQRLFFLLSKRKNETAETLAKADSLNGMPVRLAAPTFYLTPEDVVLSIQDLGDMTKYDGLGKKDFVREMKELWEKARER